MPKTVEEPKLTGDKFVLVGFVEDLMGQNSDFLQLSGTPIIQPFDGDDLWWVPFGSWSAGQAKRLRSGEERYYNPLNTSEYIIIRENQYLNMAGEAWLAMLTDVAPELTSYFDGWKSDESIHYSMRYSLGTFEEHKAFNTELAERLEALIVAALKSGDMKTLALAHHLYESATIYSNVPRAHSIVVTGVYCSVVDRERGLPLIEHVAKLEKLYRNHKKWESALSDYRVKNGIS